MKPKVFEDICMRIPYKPLAKVKDYGAAYNEWVTCATFQDLMSANRLSVKLYLRPLIDARTEELESLLTIKMLETMSIAAIQRIASYEKTFINTQKCEYWEIKVYFTDGDIRVFNIGVHTPSCETSLAVIKYLLSKHFDIHKLIPNGDAVNVNKEFYDEQLI